VGEERPASGAAATSPARTTYRIAMIQRFLPSRSPGGAGHFAHGLANALAARGHRVTMVSEDPPPEDARYEGWVLPRATGRLAARLAPFTFPFRVARLDFAGFDLVHAQGDDQFIPRRTAPPIVRTLHGSSLAEAVHNGLRRGSLKRFLVHLAFYAGELVATARADAVVAVSRASGRHVFRVHAVVPNGVDLDRFAPRGEAKASRPSILFVGELASRKRGYALLDAVRRDVRPCLPDAEVWLVSPDRADGEGIVWVGPVDDERLAELYRRAWVLCLPSSYEGFGRPYIEAMAAGTPVVATSNPGAREVLEDGRDGVLVDLRGLGAALRWLLTDPAARARYAERGLARARSFAWDVVAERYEAIYGAVVQRRRERRAA
jgi:phosphatidylinositol alpha-mannosyltransferase